MKCALWIYFGDSWAYETKGYMYTTYYPESGGSYSQSAVDITTSFEKTAGLRYDRDSNSIRSAIDGNVVTLGPVYNASRIVSYIVIMTQRYDGWTLLDMRVHEISVLASVRATPPWLPETPPSEEPAGIGNDGISSDCDGFTTDSIILTLNNAIRFYWELVMFWPRLFMSIAVVMGSTIEALMSTDLTGDMQVRSYSICSEAEASMDEGEVETVIFEAFDVSGVVLALVRRVFLFGSAAALPWA